MVWNSDGLTHEQRTMLTLERQHWKSAGAKDATVLSLLYLNPATYYRKLHALVQTPEAQRFDPITCRRVLDLRDARRAQRSAARMRLARD